MTKINSRFSYAYFCFSIFYADEPRPLAYQWDIYIGVYFYFIYFDI